jgi:ABC-type bacteriocin/lantibiotic exporter with double-glycine peptidase domain
MNFYLSVFLLLSKKKLISLLVISLLTFFLIVFELLTISSIVPLLNFLSSNNDNTNYNYILSIIKFLNINSVIESNLNFYIYVFVFFFILSTIFKILLSYINGYIAYSLGHDLNKLIYSKLLKKDYIYYITNSSSSFLGAINKSSFIRSAVFHIIQLLTSASLAFFIFIYMFFLQSNLVLVSIIFVFLFYLFFFKFLKSKITKFSKIESKSINLKYKIAQDSFSNFKEIIILNVKNYFYDQFAEADKRLTKIYIFKNTISIIPSQISIIFALLSILSLSLLFNNGFINLNLDVSLIGALIFSLQRIMPHINNIFDSITKLKSSKYSMADYFSIIEDNKDSQDSKSYNSKKIKFKNKIEIKNGCFKYNANSNNILEMINLSINKNSTVGIYGKSGTGKSTLVNILTGLINLDSGELLVDKAKVLSKNKFGWQKNIFYVAQDTMLFDASIIENILFKSHCSKKEINRINLCLKISEIYDDIYNLKDNIHTIVGEKGIKFSGGQKQRLAIARALFHNRNLLILDEATNSLDEKTEYKIFMNLKKYFKKKTIIIISHRKSVYKNCDYVLKLYKKKITKINYLN